MQVILVSDLERVGKKGQIVSVKDGYGRNFLIPKGLALLATPAARAQAAALQASREHKEALLKEKAAELAQRLQRISLVIPMAAGDQGKLHGAVTAADLVENLKAKGVTLEKHQVLLEAPLTELGSAVVALKLHPEVSASLQVQIVRK